MKKNVLSNMKKAYDNIEIPVPAPPSMHLS